MGTDWRLWQRMALNSQGAAELLWSAGHLRPCASRVYYAAYQAITAVLLYRGMIPPAGREAWSHEDTPRMIEEHWTPLISSLDRRRDLARRLADLYKLRVTADYVGNTPITLPAVQKAMRDGSFLVHVASDLLPRE